MEVRPMPSSRSLARAHYDAAERLLMTIDETPDNAAELALVHATLANVAARKLRQRKAPPAHGQLPPGLSWGDDQ
jgi:hypothetical protein